MADCDLPAVHLLTLQYLQRFAKRIFAQYRDDKGRTIVIKSFFGPDGEFGKVVKQRGFGFVLVRLVGLFGCADTGDNARQAQCDQSEPTPVRRAPIRRGRRNGYRFIFIDWKIRVNTSL